MEDAVASMLRTLRPGVQLLTCPVHLFSSCEWTK